MQGVLVHLHADALHTQAQGGLSSLGLSQAAPRGAGAGGAHLQHALHVQDGDEALLVLVEHVEPLLVPAREGLALRLPGLQAQQAAALLPHSPLNVCRQQADLRAVCQLVCFHLVAHLVVQKRSSGFKLFLQWKRQTWVSEQQQVLTQIFIFYTSLFGAST